MQDDLSHQKNINTTNYNDTLRNRIYNTFTYFMSTSERLKLIYLITNLLGKQHNCDGVKYSRDNLPQYAGTEMNWIEFIETRNLQQLEAE